MRIKVSRNSALTIPAKMRKRDGITPGEQFDIKRVRSGEYLLKRVAPQTISAVEWLLACPEKGWFRPLPSESTDSL